MPELLLLAIASAFWPVLLAVVTVALHGPRPARVLTAFLVGGLLTCVIIGFVVVSSLEGRRIVTNTRSAADPAVQLVAGGLLLVLAVYLARRRPRPKPTGDSGHSFAERAVTGSILLAFAAGVVLNVVPGVLPVVALKDIAQRNSGTVMTVGLITAFYVVMFAFIELPLIGYLVAPQRTAADAARLTD